MISRRLVDAMGGQIGVESQVGRGSRFWFTVSLRSSKDTRPENALASTAIRGMRVLVVDDTPANRLVECTYLRSWGLKPEEAPAENG